MGLSRSVLPVLTRYCDDTPLNPVQVAATRSEFSKDPAVAAMNRLIDQTGYKYFLHGYQMSSVQLPFDAGLAHQITFPLLRANTYAPVGRLYYYWRPVAPEGAPPSSVVGLDTAERRVLFAVGSEAREITNTGFGKSMLPTARTTEALEHHAASAGFAVWRIKRLDPLLRRITPKLRLNDWPRSPSQSERSGRHG